jgi:hypothetical protein
VRVNDASIYCVKGRGRLTKLNEACASPVVSPPFVRSKSYERASIFGCRNRELGGYEKVYSFDCRLCIHVYKQTGHIERYCGVIQPRVDRRRYLSTKTLSINVQCPVALVALELDNSTLSVFSTDASDVFASRSTPRGSNIKLLAQGRKLNITLVRARIATGIQPLQQASPFFPLGCIIFLSLHMGTRDTLDRGTDREYILFFWLHTGTRDAQRDVSPPDHAIQSLSTPGWTHPEAVAA